MIPKILSIQAPQDFLKPHQLFYYKIVIAKKIDIG